MAISCGRIVTVIDGKLSVFVGASGVERAYRWSGERVLF